MNDRLDNIIWKIRQYLRNKYGIDRGDNLMYPLVYYINTGRASTPFIKALIDSKPFVIGRVLANGGSDVEIIRKIKHKLNMKEVI